MPLSKRLAAIAALVRPGRRLADIGTDHARLPIHLVKTGIISAAVAADIAEGPLNRARENIAAAGLGGQIEVLRSNGLQAIDPHSVDDIVIAGMGGETIAEILEARGFSYPGHHRFILNPMSRPERLERRLVSAGFNITGHETVAEGRRTYHIYIAEKGN